MKLYTEEDVLRMLRSFHTSEINVQLCMLKLTPIELPSDEEIWNEGKLVFNEKGKTIYTHYNTVPSWSDGAKWMRDEIQGGNK